MKDAPFGASCLGLTSTKHDVRRESVMEDVRQIWSWWQSLLIGFRRVFTGPGWVRFVQWVTGTVLCWEEHTITQILVSLAMESRWRVLECFAEYGAWDRERVEQQTVRLIEQEHPAKLGKYHPVALDDTKEHRTSQDVWGTCTFHESSARSPNRAETVRAHNWVVAGDLIAGKPWSYLPHTARLYFRKSQLPVGETFQTKTALAVQMLRQIAAESPSPVLAVTDGAYAVDTVVQPCLNPPPGQARIDVVSRPRTDARLYHPPLANRVRPDGKKRSGPDRKWGRRMPSPKRHAEWDTPWKNGKAYIYGRLRKVRYKQVLCQWAVSGWKHLVHAFVFEVEGYEEPWYLISTALDLSAEQAVEIFAARFRQENGFRDHKQRLGMEECRAWTKEPVLRTFQVQMIALTLLRLLQFRLDAAWGAGEWWLKPEWNLGKQHPSILDLRRLFWRHRERIAQLLLKLEELDHSETSATKRQRAAQKAA